MSVKKLKTFEDAMIDLQFKYLCRFTEQPKVDTPGEGVLVRTPDGTKFYRIRVDNSGNIVTELVTV